MGVRRREREFGGERVNGRDNEEKVGGECLLTGEKGESERGRERKKDGQTGK